MNKRGPGSTPRNFQKKIDWKWLGLIRVILEHICEFFFFIIFFKFIFFFGIRSNSGFSGAVGSYGVCVIVCVIAHVRACLRYCTTDCKQTPAAPPSFGSIKAILKSIPTLRCNNARVIGRGKRKQQEDERIWP